MSILVNHTKNNEFSTNSTNSEKIEKNSLSKTHSENVIFKKGKTRVFHFAKEKSELSLDNTGFFRSQMAIIIVMIQVFIKIF